MIPASYLFKDIYRQHWDTPDAPVTARSHHFITGLLSPLTGIVATLARRRRAPARHFGVHAYD